jgi:phosphate/sulfate permease
MIVTESILWVIVWIIGMVVTVGVFYYMNNKVTLANMVGAVFIWWIILPLFVLGAIVCGLVWLMTTSDEIVLFEKKDWWMTKEDRKRYGMEERKPKKTKEFFDTLQKMENDSKKLNNNNISEK